MVGWEGGHHSFLFWGEACSWMGPQGGRPPSPGRSSRPSYPSRCSLCCSGRRVIRPAPRPSCTSGTRREAVQEVEGTELERTMLDEAGGEVGRSHPSHTWRSRGVAVSSRALRSSATQPCVTRPPGRMAVTRPPAAFHNPPVGHLLGELFVHCPIYPV